MANMYQQHPIDSFRRNDALQRMSSWHAPSNTYNAAQLKSVETPIYTLEQGNGTPYRVLGNATIPVGTPDTPHLQRHWSDHYSTTKCAIPVQINLQAEFCVPPEASRHADQHRNTEIGTRCKKNKDNSLRQFSHHTLYPSKVNDGRIAMEQADRQGPYCSHMQTNEKANVIPPENYSLHNGYRALDRMSGHIAPSYIYRAVHFRNPHFNYRFGREPRLGILRSRNDMSSRDFQGHVTFADGINPKPLIPLSYHNDASSSMFAFDNSSRRKDKQRYTFNRGNASLLSDDSNLSYPQIPGSRNYLRQLRMKLKYEDLDDTNPRKVSGRFRTNRRNDPGFISSRYSSDDPDFISSRNPSHVGHKNFFRV